MVTDLNEWIIRTKGWALTLKKPGPKQKLLKGKTKRIQLIEFPSSTAQSIDICRHHQKSSRQKVE